MTSASTKVSLFGVMALQRIPPTPRLSKGYIFKLAFCAIQNWFRDVPLKSLALLDIWLVYLGHLQHFLFLLAVDF